MKRILLLTCIALSLHGLFQVVVAQPNDYEQWVERAVWYARTWYDDYNPEYGFCDNNEDGQPDHDCAHFCSQIANSGCAGMCEVNSTNINREGYPPWLDGECNEFHNTEIEDWQEGWEEAEDHCIQVIGDGHWVLTVTAAMDEWFDHSPNGWPYEYKNINSLGDVPRNIDAGFFAMSFRRRNPNQNWIGHAMFIGSTNPHGNGREPRYWAHSPARGAGFDRTHGASIYAFYQTYPNHTMRINFYGAQPFCPKREQPNFTSEEK